MYEEWNIIIELAEYLKGNRGDADGYLRSFFERRGGGGYLCLDAISVHARMESWTRRELRIRYDDPCKKRMINFGCHGG